ncbi:MAG TPA: PilZ domain-containing protein [Syntrophobacteria bacterium]|nr:PilZ domain-containing protein [Syntrophobacteria bacterium]
MEPEHRRQPRAKVRWPVVLLAANGHIFGQTLDISLNGALIRSLEKPELADSFRLILKPPERRPFLTVTARQVWLATFHGGCQTLLHSVGVEFLCMPDDDRRFLSDKILENLKANSGK